MTDFYADHGSVLPNGVSALVVDRTGKLNLYLSNGPEDEDMQPMVQLLAAVLLRSEDPDWIAEMLAPFSLMRRT